ncbi:MAG: hypothetical protein HOV94_26510 [Saccharothrix sp.]|nr:hypothetical protein [Saccharothrix sp.]
MTAVDASGTRPGGVALSCRAVERTVCEVWGGVFGVEVSPYDDFFELGGDSLTIIEVVDELSRRGVHVRSSVALRNHTPARLAEALTVHADRTPVPGPPADPGDLRPRPRSWAEVPCGPAVLVPDGAGAALVLFHSDTHPQREREAAVAWRTDRPVVGFPAPGVEAPLPADADLVDIARHQVRALLAARPQGPYPLVGFGLGAVLAFEVAVQLRRAGHEVPVLVMVEPPAAGAASGYSSSAADLLARRYAALGRRFALSGSESPEEVLSRVREEGWYDADTGPADLSGLQLAWAGLALAVRGYDPDPYTGRVVLCSDEKDAPTAVAYWSALLTDPAVHLFDYGVESPVPVLGDPRLAAVVRAELRR